ncbi:glycosyltransferase [Cellulosimicrobium sp. NPDC057127]|uniref:glycosyltransferase n=1 Tax=Cellulosimicrobium sp. NPDC057127 TaxID=3346026 RepID=UPI0036421734
MTNAATSEQFSVLLPVYHRDDPDHLERSFRSVTQEQSLRPSEVVIVQDGPVGPSLATALERCSRSSPVPVRTVVLDQNVGLARALEAGLARCRFEIVARQDADDVSRADRFAVQVPLVAGGVDIVGSAIEEFEEDDSQHGMVRVPPLSSEAIARRARFASPFNHPSVVYRRSAVLAAGGYEDLHLMEDYWLFVRMLAAGVRGRNVAEPLVRYRVGAGAYARRGGRALLASELRIQRRMRAAGFTSRVQYVRNVLVRGGYRVLGEPVRRALYRAWSRVSRRS